MKVLLGMSGGFDSSYSVGVLQRMGYTVEGACIVMHDRTDISLAENAAKLLGIKLHIIDARELFESCVIENFISEYKNARTPNPCLVCNPNVKFKCLYKFAKENDFDKIATGHYATLSDYVGIDGKTHRALGRAKDISKDQSYMLYRLSEDILKMLILPLGEYTKSELRRSVEGTPLASLDRPDSQEICWLPDGDYPTFIEDRIGCFPHGSFIDSSGNVLGEHKGIIRYTVGQRKRLGISLGERAFVTDIDPEANTVTLSCSPRVRSEIELSSVVTIDNSHKMGITRRYNIKVRYSSSPVVGDVTFLCDGRAKVKLGEPVAHIARGQSAVFYEGDTLVGGGIIEL